MQHRQLLGWTLVVLVASTYVTPVLCYPGGLHPAAPEPRKFAEKPNALKKVAIDNDLDDVSTNQIQDGFSWSNMLGMVMQLLFNGGNQGPNKSDGMDSDQLYSNSVAPSPWANFLSVGLKILTALLGGGHGGNDGIDKVDNGSPMQFINIVVNLLDALKTSFSHRSHAARSHGRKDSISEAAIAGISLLKGYVKTMRTADDNCVQKFMCEANRECSTDTQGAIFCQLGSYATSMLLEKQSPSNFDTYYEAGRKGRSGEDCRQHYLSCNEV